MSENCEDLPEVVYVDDSDLPNVVLVEGGSPGLDGKPGTRWIVSTGEPSATPQMYGASQNDLYLDESTGMVWRAVSLSVWEQAGTLRGPVGPAPALVVTAEATPNTTDVVQTQIGEGAYSLHFRISSAGGGASNYVDGGNF